MEYTWHYPSPLGGITMAGSDGALTGLWFDGQRYFASGLAQTHRERYIPVFGETVRWLDLYFGGAVPPFTPMLRLKAPPFRRAVWTVLLTIPYGETMTYGEIARVLARQQGLPGMSARAVGGAVAHNAISLIIPCHRVIGSDGSLTGYAGGVDKKTRLLSMEKAAPRRKETV